ncbi:MAG: HD domain-containing protein [Eggerthellaceae bacterium]|nr:HD domain-containing protein [Eggerthellaceae bacterium]
MVAESNNSLFAFTEEERAYLREGMRAQDELLSPFATRDEDAIYERPDFQSEDAALVRSAFVRDVDRVLNNAFYNRCMDKTQVFPFYRNDDLTRRSYHLQLVSQNARKLGAALRLNTKLIEAIALGHDLGHTPFGHCGEHVLSDLYHTHTADEHGRGGRYFNHNVHGVRLIRTVASRNLSLQTLNGILCHCGEKAFDCYTPNPCDTFDQLDAMMERCYTKAGESQTLRPSTLEGCVVRICDILAYLGKDRQDALRLRVISEDEYEIEDSVLGHANRDFISNTTANIIKNSIGKPYLAMDEEVFAAIMSIKDLNARTIYLSDQAHVTFDRYIKMMMARLYERLLEDLKAGDEGSFIFRHHLNAWMLRGNDAYANEDPNDVVVDYIASMTDEYFVNLFNFLYPEEAVSEEQLYVPYFR